MSRRVLDGVVEQLDSVVRAAMAPLQDELVNLRKQVSALRKELTATHMQWHQEMRDNQKKLQGVAAGTPQIPPTPQQLGTPQARQMLPHQQNPGVHGSQAHLLGYQPTAGAAVRSEDRRDWRKDLGGQEKPAGAVPHLHPHQGRSHARQEREPPPFALDLAKQPQPAATPQHQNPRNLRDGVPFSDEPEVPWQRPLRAGEARQQQQRQGQYQRRIPPDVINRWRERVGGKASEAWSGLARAFRAFDWNGDGVIDAGEFERLLLRWHIPQDDIHQIFRYIDRDKNGGIDYREFQNEFGAAISGDKAYAEWQGGAIG